MGQFLIGNTVCVIWREDAGSPVTLRGKKFFLESASTVLKWERESVLGSGGWGQMMKILISLEECWAESSLENYKSSWSELAVSYV